MTPADRAYVAFLTATLARLYGLRAAWLWWEVGRGLRERARAVE